MRAKLVVALSFVAGIASADPHHVLVLKSEGPADAATRAKVDASIVKLAKHLDGKVTAGDITLGDAAAAVGCQPETPQCKDEVLATLAVDEVVATTVVPERNGNLKITVRRISKASTKDATTTIAPTQTDKLDPISPLFGMPAAPGPAPVTAPTTSPAPSPTPAISTTTPPTGDTPPPETAPAPTPVPAPAPAALPPPTTTMTEVDDHSGRRRYELAGMIGGGGCVVLSFVLWGAAASTQKDIDKAPTKTTKDIQNLKDLESKGDAQAGLGNLLFVGGIALGAVSTYFYIKDRNSHGSSQARVTPTVFDHGAGLTLTIGGAP